MGVERVKKITILEDAIFDYTPSQMEKFIKMWNEGYGLEWMARKMNIAKYNVVLLIIHCDLEGLIGERPGGYNGTVAPKERKKRETMKIEYQYQDKRMNTLKCV